MGKPTNTTQPRIKGRFAAKSAPRKRAAKPKEPTQLEAMEARIIKRIKEVYNTAKSANIGADNALEAIREVRTTLSKVESSVAVIRSGAGFMQQLEQDAPRPVEAPAEVWVPKVGEWVVLLVDSAIFSQGHIDKVLAPDDSEYVYLPHPKYPNGAAVHSKRLRPATEADLAAEEARRKEAERAQKAAKLVFGVRVMTPDGEGIFHESSAGVGHWVIFPHGQRNFTLDEITSIQKEIDKLK